MTQYILHFLPVYNTLRNRQNISSENEVRKKFDWFILYSVRLTS
jgi:hypothetical protein